VEVRGSRGKKVWRGDSGEGGERDRGEMKGPHDGLGVCSTLVEFYCCTVCVGRMRPSTEYCSHDACAILCMLYIV